MKNDPSILPQGPLRVLRLEASNVKRVKMFSIVPKADVVEFTGANGAGKTSAIDSLMYLIGGKRLFPSDPVRDGAEEMTIMAELGGEKVELRVTRTQSKDGESHTLLVETARGARYDQPQRLLNDLVPSIAFDPSDFYNANETDKLEMLKRLVPLDINLAEHDGRIQVLFDTRTGVGREKVHYRERADAYLIGADWPTERIDDSKLLRRMELAAAHNQNLESERSLRNRKSDEAANLRATAKASRARAEALRLEMMAELQTADEYEERATQKDDEVAALPPLSEAEDVSEIRVQIETAKAHNEKVRLYDEFRTVERQFDAKDTEYKRLTDEIEGLRSQRRAAIARAPMPMKGLGFRLPEPGEKSKGEVTYNGKPLEQASGAEQMRVALAVVSAHKSQLKVILVRDGTKFDSVSRAVIRDFAKEKGLQIFVERVQEKGPDGTDARVGVFFEDGGITFCDPEMAEALI